MSEQRNSTLPLGPARVIKLGGSLLGDPAWPVRFRHWLARQERPGGVLIVGGGPMVDIVRGWDEVHCLGETPSHWLAIRAMGVTARLAHELLPEAEWIDSWPNLMNVDHPNKLVLFEPLTFLRDVEPTLPDERLPASWEATSDSIAARIATVLGCEELVLMKSCLPPDGEAKDLALLAVRGFVDRCFPRIARQIPVVRFVDLKAE